MTDPNAMKIRIEMETDGLAYYMTKREAMAMHEPVPEDMSVSLAEALVGMKMPEYTDSHIDNARFWATAHAAYRVMQADALLAELARTK